MPVLFANPRRQVFSRCGPFNVSIADPESFNIKFSFQYIRLETCHDWPSLTLKQSKIYHLRKRKKARDPKWILVVPLLIFPSCTGELSKKKKKKRSGATFNTTDQEKRFSKSPKPISHW